ncbi:estradiol 17-beta-dehydrogenase, putative [Entamoeba dispar SAW760]|uniref:Estradiol 17-beta-dehydrogenase, putative n=1 Tax=Entamoeba dispar (strain ATCC PRA-260 / SAW760) TaxID=370354 RepID=B0ELF8_ENTDS|nr:estradiol 17-beta-dehydrogenase, putative [Entamoeba dispar SAW760]EDR24648.1 estradiol 17-beta-dehydrogenase, putative [Entamoeba dispar SAW760]|eukprot:EDR24648.1 estradiol 17-beta-dehydrogenase, putative [Entamoeba dispar SAW760]
MNSSQQIALLAIGILINIILILPLVLFIWRFVIRRIIHPNPIQKYHAKNSFALITGASEGVGRSFAERLGKEGFNLILIARRTELLNEIKKELESKYKIKVITLTINLYQINEVQWKLIDNLLEENNVTVLINNVSRSIKGMFTDIPLEETNNMIKLNIEITSQITHLFIHHSIKNAKNLIIFMSSCTSKTPAPYSAIYASTKEFIFQLSRSISYEYSNIDCTVFRPWHISTEMIGKMQPSLSVCTPDQFVDSALTHVGLTRVIDPYWFHYFEDWSYDCLPDDIKSFLIVNEFKKFKELRKENNIL